MKKTISINLGGRVFVIDDDAYSRLEKYLADINKRFTDPDNGQEIVSDVEMRIAELFDQLIGNNKEVITISDVEKIIKILGEPKYFDEGDDYDEKEQKSSTSKNNSSERAKYRRLYRNPDDRVLGGVCSGIAAYFGIDPLIVRIIMLITAFTFGFGIFLYVALWILVPAAITTSQKLEMSGEKVNIENIENKIREEFEEIKKNFNDIKKKSINEDKFPKIFENIGEVFLQLIKIFAVFIGSIFAFVSIVTIIALIIFVFTNNFTIFDTEITNFTSLFIGISNPNIIVYALLFIIFGIVLAILSSSFIIIFGKKHRWNIFGLTSSLFWIVGICLLIYTTFKVVVANKVTETYMSEKTYIAPDTLYLNTVNNYTNDLDFDETIDFNNFSFAIYNSDLLFYKKPKFKVEKHESESIRIRIERKSNGRSIKKAQENAKEILYGSFMKNDTLYIDKYFKLRNNAS